MSLNQKYIVAMLQKETIMCELQLMEELHPEADVHVNTHEETYFVFMHICEKCGKFCHYEDLSDYFFYGVCSSCRCEIDSCDIHCERECFNKQKYTQSDLSEPF